MRADLAVGPHCLHVDAELDGNPAGNGRTLGIEASITQGLAACKSQLQLDEVDAHHLLGDGVLDLQPRVHLDEGERLAVRFHQELEGTEALVALGSGEAHRGARQLLAHGRQQPRAGRHLHELLVASLKGAFPLTEVHDLAERISHDLDLEVAGARHQPLHVEVTVAEGRLGLGATAFVCGLELSSFADDPHAAPAAASHGLEEQRFALG